MHNLLKQQLLNPKKETLEFLKKFARSYSSKLIEEKKYLKLETN